MPLHCPKENQKTKQNKINIKSEKLNKRKEKLSVSKVFHNNDNNSIDVGQISSLVNTISDNEELNFSRYDVNSMIDYLDNQIIMNMDMCYQSSNLILYTYI